VDDRRRRRAGDVVGACRVHARPRRVLRPVTRSAFVIGFVE
jgi:hypothetical protein